MGKDPFKKYTEDNREEFDSFEQPDFEGLWGDISDSLDKQDEQLGGKPPIRRSLWGNRVWLKVAAMLIMAFGVGWLTVSGVNNFGSGTEWAETQEFYQESIQTKMEALQARREAIDPKIFEDLESLDTALQELKVDLEDQADNEEVVNAMIMNYQIKLKILEEILDELQQDDSQQQHESTADPQA